MVTVHIGDELGHLIEEARFPGTQYRLWQLA